MKVWNFYGSYGLVAGIFEKDGDTPLGIEYRLTPRVTAVEEGTALRVPKGFALSQNFPNPFNATTTIPFSLSREGNISIVVYTLMGQRIRTLVDGLMSVGEHAVQWDGKDGQGKEVAGGVYLVRMSVRGDPFSDARKVTLLR